MSHDLLSYESGGTTYLRVRGAWHIVLRPTRLANALRAAFRMPFLPVLYRVPARSELPEELDENLVD